MKAFVLMVVVLLALVVLLAGPVVARLAYPRTDCSKRGDGRQESAGGTARMCLCGGNIGGLLQARSLVHSEGLRPLPDTSPRIRLGGQGRRSDERTCAGTVRQ